jgi:Alginate lyase
VPAEVPAEVPAGVPTGVPLGPGPVLTPGICWQQTAFPIPTQAPVLSDWTLILPVNKKGQFTGNQAAQVTPAKPIAPYLSQQADGSLALYAPSVGATTTNSLHPRTELVRRQGFRLVPGTENTMTATLAVTQVPKDTHKIIVGQLHAAKGPFVTLRYSDGRINVISADGSDCTLLTGVALGQKFSYQITQKGYELLYEASTTVNGQTVTRAVATMIPTAFRNDTGQFSAGDYEQATVHVAGSGGRVTFYDLETASR